MDAPFARYCFRGAVLFWFLGYFAPLFLVPMPVWSMDRWEVWSDDLFMAAAGLHALMFLIWMAQRGLRVAIGRATRP